MLNSLKSLFQRYRQARVTVHAVGPALIDSNGVQHGQIDMVTTTAGLFVVSGWSLSDDIGLLVNSQRSRIQNRSFRQDVVDVFSIAENPKLGFHVEGPMGPNGVFLSTTFGDQTYFYQIPLPNPSQSPAKTFQTGVCFCADLLRATPLFVRWLITRDQSYRTKVRQKLIPNPPDIKRFSILDADMLTLPAKTEARGTGKITIVLPVFNALDLLPEVLDRVRRHTDLPWHLIVIEDASTDPSIRPFLRAWVDEGNEINPDQVTLLENDENLGFIRSVNRGFSAASERDGTVILLNSDAFVPAGWASRLVAPILADPTVASVTPMSNDAEIFSVPVVCQKVGLKAGQGDDIDQAARRLGPSANVTTAPTGVGFCMAMSPKFLNKLAEFDTSFGRGYGEEVDWCQRARALGGKHVGIANLFVEHRGGESFGNTEKLKLIARNGATISSRYKNYDSEVQAFIHTDPLVSARLALGVAWAGSQSTDRLPIYVAHSLGGGAEDHLARRITEDMTTKGAAIVLRVGGATRWTLEVHGQQGICSAATDSFALIKSLLDPVKRRHLIYSCAVGDKAPWEIPANLLSLYRPETDSLETLFHNFFPLSPSYTLLDGDGRYLGPPQPGQDFDVVPDGTETSLRDWRDAWEPLLAASDRLIVFSPSSRDIVTLSYPALAQKVVVIPHSDMTALPRLTVQDGPPVIGVLGNIGFEKGARVLMHLGKSLDPKLDGRLVIIGNIDPAYAPPSSVAVHGNYDIANIEALVSRYRINRWLIPSICPETFSYTTRECLSTGLPVYCFDLGGQADALHSASNGFVLPLSLAEDTEGLAKVLSGELIEGASAA